MKRTLLTLIFLSLTACSVLYPGFSTREPSLAHLEVGKTTYKQALREYGTPAMSVVEFPRGMRMTYLFRTPEAVVDRGLLMRGSYQDGCKGCGRLTLVFERVDNSLDNMVLVGIARSTPAVEALYVAGMKHIHQGEFEQALPLIEAASQARFSDAEFTLGLMHLKGDGVARDYTKARHWFTRAAAAGHVDARYDLGAMYRNGEGVAVNRDAAKALFLSAAQAGNRRAAGELAKLYEEDGDLANARKWSEVFARK